jgi:hypothetical protein
MDFSVGDSEGSLRGPVVLLSRMTIRIPVPPQSIQPLKSGGVVDGQIMSERPVSSGISGAFESLSDVSYRRLSGGG